MNNSYVLSVLLALVHDRLKRLWNVVEHRHVQTFTSYVHTTHTRYRHCLLLVILYQIMFAVTTIIVFSSSKYFFAVPYPMFILNPVQHSACRNVLMANLTHMTPAVHSPPDLTTADQLWVRFGVFIDGDVHARAADTRVH